MFLGQKHVVNSLMKLAPGVYRIFRDHHILESSENEIISAVYRYTEGSSINAT